MRRVGLTRRDLGRLALVGAVAARGRPAHAAGALRILARHGYADDAWVKAFQAQTAASLAVTTVGSADEALAKAAASSGADHDVVILDTASARGWLAQK